MENKQIYYQQCVLCKNNNNIKQISFIPDEFAVVGKKLKIKVSGKWQEGWVVVEVFDWLVKDVTKFNVIKQIKDHKKSTGDSLPKNEV